MSIRDRDRVHAERIAQHREYARKSREEAADPANDHYAVSLRENAAEWDRIADWAEGQR